MSNRPFKSGDLTPEQRRELLGRLLAKKGDKSRIAPVSFAQQRLWLVEKMSPDSALYNLPMAINLNGNLDVPSLQQSLDELVVRHETLRTTFADKQGEPVQVIHPPKPNKFKIIDLSHLTQSERKVESRSLAEIEALSPFDLAKGPLFRTQLICLNESEHILLLTMHHIISDGWSRGVLIRELAALYEAINAGQPPPKDKSTVQYADYAAWQRRQFSGKDLQSQLDYWRQELADLQTLQLPTDNTRPGVQTFQGDLESLVLEKELGNSLKRLCREEGTTLFMTLLAAFNVLLHRYTDQEDIVAGSPIANRNRPEIEGLIGFFVNMLVMRTDISGNPSFRQLLAREREMALGAYQHQDLPFEKLVEELQPERDTSRSPLFQVIFALQNPPTPPLKMKDLTLTLLPTQVKTVRFDLEAHVSESREGFVLSFIYNTALFESGTIRRMLDHYRQLLEGIAEDPALPISALPLLDDIEQHQLLEEWNRTVTAYPRETPVHELFEEQVKRTPDSVAVSYGDSSLSYTELNDRANQLAWYLKRCGVGTEVMVGICIERSLEMVVGILGILKAGGAYVPLDPEYPGQRLTFMLEDTSAPVLLTQNSLKDIFPDYSGTLICLDGQWNEIEQEPTDNLLSGASARNLAYVIYTSGSTGRPKGTCIEHRSVVRLVKETNYFELAQDEVFLQFAPISFDASTFELWASLLNGAKLVVYPAGKTSLNALAEFIEQQSITILWLTAALFHQMVESHLETLSRVGQVLAGGEALSSTHVKKLIEVMGDNRLINGYGPTENTTFTACHVMTSSSRIGWSVPIGVPISNTQVYILDSHLQPVPVGVYGELFIGGDGLAREYLNRPELTAERFIPNPFSDGPSDSTGGSRLYRTGDRVRYLEDGSIEFQGRFDHQVKIRGFRVELGEIETILAQHSEVEEAVVLCREDVPGDKRLVAYVVGYRTGNPSIGDLRQFVKDELPSYMVPAAFVVLDKMPLTANGKVDRKALPEPTDARAWLESCFIGPRTEVEKALTEIWADVLNSGPIGIHDNFFDLGGHSLAAIRVVSRVRDALNFELPLVKFFAHPTVYDLAKRIENLRRSDKKASPPIVPLDRTEPPPLSFAQQRLWFLDRIKPGNPSYNIPLLLKLKGKLNISALEESLKEIVRRHEVLRTTFAFKHGKPVQVIGDVYTAELTFEDLHELPNNERHNLVFERVKEVTQEAFDLSQGPMLRAVLYRLDTNEHVLALVMHHIVSDGWSLEIFFRELATLYRAFLRKEPSPLPELQIQYSDFAVWQRLWLQGEALETELKYWREKLKDLPILQITADHRRPSIQTFRGSRETLILPKALSRKLAELSRQEGATLFMTLLTVFSELLHRYTGQNDIVVGSPIANRNRSEIEDLIGFFVNMLVLRLDTSGHPSFRELLSRVRETALDAYQHQDLPFEKLVEELQPERDTSRSPLFQVTFAVQNAPPPYLEMEDLTLNPMQTESFTAHFELEVHIWENPEGLIAQFVYNTDLFEGGTIRRMLGHYRQLLEGIAENPARPFSDLPLLDDIEQHQLLKEWNRTATGYPRESPVHELFEEQVKRKPDSVAVTYGNSSLSYTELNDRANQLASYLKHCGVGPEVMVGICIERSLEMVVGILGVLKAGGAYVPMDPDYPGQRLAFMLNDTAAPVLLTKSSFTAKLPDYSGTVVYLDSEWHRIEEESQSFPVCGVCPDHLAYVIYTSGSTGRPKGVEITHEALLNLVYWHQRTYSLMSSDRATQLAGLGFDASVWELWPYLTSGGSIHIPDDETLMSPVNLWSWLAETGITVTFLPTPLAEAVLRDLPTDTMRLRTVLTGGDRLHGGLNMDLPFSLVNHYGPTENTVVTTFAQIGLDSSDESPPPIGRPIDNVQVYILDSRLQPVPVGVSGELYVGGSGLARGYMKRPEHTAECFIPNPFSNKPGARLYKTGDQVRYRADGNIEFLGRLDDQVKIRGFRIEIGEIEAVLMKHQAVHKAVVLCREDTPREKRLVAYVVMDHESDSAINDLRSFLGQRLPGYMVPAAFVELDELPLTPNGKIDRKALPMPDGVRPGQHYVPPETEGQRILAAIWQELLNVETVGVHDNFFDLGGHSLLLMQAVDMFEKKTAYRLKPASFFNQTLGQLVASYGDSKLHDPSEGIQVVDQDIEPFYFGTHDRPLFGCYRLARSSLAQGIVLCHPHAHEYVRCHRAFRELALRLARAGYHVLCFDYYGCGDSGGDYEQGRISGWCQDTLWAIDAMKKRFGLDRVSLVGLRLGATLALMAGSNRDDIDAMVLWDPIVNGKPLVRELIKMGKFQHRWGAAKAKNNDGYDVLGYPLTYEMIEDLGRIELSALPYRPAKELLVLSTHEPGDSTLDTFLKHLGNGIDYQHVSDSRIWLQEPYEAVVPQQALDLIVSWISKVCP